MTYRVLYKHGIAIKKWEPHLQADIDLNFIKFTKFHNIYKKKKEHYLMKLKLKKPNNS